MKYSPFSTFIFRLPSLSFGNVADLPSNYQSLLEIFSIPFVQDAVYLASPVLYHEIQKLKDGEIKDKKEIERIISSWLRYISRMSTRCTPFGLFAGCGVGVIGEKNSILLENSFRATTRLDMYFLSSLHDALTKNEQIRKNLKYYPNTSLYRIGQKYRFIEILYGNSQRKYHVTEVHYSRYIAEILKSTQKGMTVGELTSVLVNNGIMQKDAIEFINEICDSQLIIPELSQTVIGDDFFSRILKLLKSIQNINPLLIEKLEKIKNIILELDLKQNFTLIYKEIINIIKELNIPYEERFLFQVDMIKNTLSASISNDVIKELKSSIGFLNKITPIYNNQNLTQFKNDFYARYENQSIPLLQVLDPDVGLGYPSNRYGTTLSPLISDLVLPLGEQQPANNTILESLLFEKTIDQGEKTKMEIELTDKDIEGLESNWDDLPPTIYTLFEILQADTDNTTIRLQACAGSSAANLLGRFAHTNPSIEQLVKDITNKEQELLPDVILAEIVHSPEARTGNVLFRPHIRDYELVFMSSSDLPQEQIILLSDIMVSVRNGRLVLYSKKLNKEIIPRLTSAHNYYYPGTMPVYRFLADMQHQCGRNSLYFSWGHELENRLSFLPRVRYKNTILSPAIWRIEVKDMKYLFMLEEKNLLKEIEQWREKFFLPRYVLMPEADNELFIDWKNPLSIQSLFSLIRKKQSVKFTEFLYDPEKSIIRDENNQRYRNECIVAFYKDVK